MADAQPSISAIANGAAALALGCGRIAKDVHDLAEQYRHTEPLLSSIPRELSTTQCAWQLIHSLTAHWRSQDHFSHDLLLRLDQSIAWGRLVLAALDAETSSCTRRLAITGDGFRNRPSRSRLPWSDRSLKKHQERIIGQNMSLGLLISVLRM